jgi:hypothetical protein
LTVSLQCSPHGWNFRVEQFIQLHFLFLCHRQFRFQERVTQSHKTVRWRNCGRSTPCRRGATRWRGTSGGSGGSQQAAGVSKRAEVHVLRVGVRGEQNESQYTQASIHNSPDA